jgi:hypothetical protein
MLAQDSDMSQPVQYDPNTGVSYYPWEEAERGAVNSYNLTNMATMSNPFSQVMAPTMDARPEEVVESKTNDTQIQEESDREPTIADEDTPSEVGAHTMRAEGDSSMSWKGPTIMGLMALGILGAFYVVTTQ